MRLRAAHLALGLLWLLLLGALLVAAEPPQTPPWPPSMLRVCPQGPPTCDFAQIQQAIEAAPAGATLEIGAGVYKEHLTIDKPLILREQGENTVVQGVLPTVAVVQIRVAQPSPVILEEISVIASPPDPSSPLSTDGVVIAGSTQAVLRRVQVSKAEGSGVSVRDAAQVTIEGSQFFRNGYGIVVDGRSRVTIRRGIIFGGGVGIILGRSVRAQLEGVRVLANSGAGISIDGPRAQVLIQDSDIAGNGFGGPSPGVSISGAADVQILQTAIYGNHGDGLSILDDPSNAIKVEVSRSFIFSNRFSGIFAHLGNPDTYVELTENEIYANLERYGVEVETPPCVSRPTTVRGTISGRKNGIPGPGEGAANRLWSRLSRRIELPNDRPRRELSLARWRPRGTSPGLY